MTTWFCEYHYTDEKGNKWSEYKLIEAESKDEAKDFIFEMNKDKYLYDIKIKKAKAGDRENKLCEIQEKTYEVTFKIKIKDTRYQKMMLIKTIDENKISDLLKIRCKKEFSGIRSINCITSKEWDGKSEEWSEVLEKKNNIVNQPTKEIKSDDSVDITDIAAVVGNTNSKAINFNLGTNDLIQYEEGDSLDQNIFNQTITYNKVTKNLEEMKPSSINILNQNEYKEYNLTINYAGTKNYPSIKILAKSSANAIMTFVLTAKNNKDIPYKLQKEYLLRYSTVYMLTEVKTGKYRAFPSSIINPMIES